MTVTADESVRWTNHQSDVQSVAIKQRSARRHDPLGLPNNRVHYLDNLRALAMLLGVFLHASLAYAHPAQSVWLATDASASVIVDASVWFIHMFRMGLFFLLSGYFAKWVIERKGLRLFLWNRFLRIVVPFALFYPFLVIAMTVVIVFARSYVKEPSGLMGVIAEATNGRSATAKQDLPGTMHLWFLYYLIAFSVAGAVLYQLKWIHLDRLLRRPIVFFICPLALIPGAFFGGTPLPAPDSFVPRFWPFAFYGLYFAAGWQLFGREKLLDSLRPYTMLLSAVGVMLFVPYYLLMPELEIHKIMDGTKEVLWKRMLEAFITAYLSVMLTLASLLLGKRYLARRSPFLAFVADSSYWIYLVHLPLVLFLQTLLLPSQLPWWLKLIAVLLGTIVPCISTYLVFVRYTPMGWLLHGKRTFP
jgi:glucans biosynthesis protein C